MAASQKLSAFVILFVGLLAGGMAGYLYARAAANKPLAPAGDHSAELAELRAELAEIKTHLSPASLDEQLKQLESTVVDILVRGDEFSLRADYARTADRLDGHTASEFAMRDADNDGTSDVEQLRLGLANVVSGKVTVAKAKAAETADSAESLGNLPPTDYALADHTHTNVNNFRVNGSLAVTGNTIASGDVQVFGEVVAVGGLLPGTVDIEAKPAIAGMIRYNRRLGVLEYCDGTRWNMIAIADQP